MLLFFLEFFVIVFSLRPSDLLRENIYMRGTVIIVDWRVRRLGMWEASLRGVRVKVKGSRRGRAVLPTRHLPIKEGLVGGRGRQLVARWKSPSETAPSKVPKT